MDCYTVKTGGKKRCCSHNSRTHSGLPKEVDRQYLKEEIGIHQFLLDMVKPPKAPVNTSCCCASQSLMVSHYGKQDPALDEHLVHLCLSLLVDQICYYLIKLIKFGKSCLIKFGKNEHNFYHI